MLKSQKTTWLTKEQGLAQREWFVLDLQDKVLGRAAAKIAMVLRGKHKPTYTPNTDTGDYVIVVNADKVKLTGSKAQRKPYRYHTGYMGGLRETTADKLLDRHPDELIRQAVQGMLPKTKLGKQMLKKLKVYAGPDHNHTAQQPRELTL